MAGEKNYERRIKAFLKENGVYYFKMLGCAATRPGVPDLICCINGRFVAIEVKSETGRLTDLQKANIELIQQSGGIALATWPDDFPHLKKIIKDILNELRN